MQESNSKRFIPTHITTLTLDNKNVDDIGRCISIRSLPIASDAELLNGYNPMQVYITSIPIYQQTEYFFFHFSLCS